ncbi:hypothetical protein [Brevibacillus dissolubilis]|uniref:hypothetical protein n=1 Tax=Brevibacillus dissolubilis TaxID=1844116 RepID=UPI0011168AEA|nr:hypothetical protein [Brevibacillus dissolubilis]
MNRYTYTHNNPIRYIDPNGHWIQGIDNQLSATDQAKIIQLTGDWYKASGNKKLQANIQQAAQRIRREHFIEVAKQIREKLHDDIAQRISDTIPNVRSMLKKASRNYLKKVVGYFDDSDVTFVFRRTDNFDAQSYTPADKGKMIGPVGKEKPKTGTDFQLSMSTNLMYPAWVTSLEAINSTGLFQAKIDGDGTYVSVTPTLSATQAFGTMKDWRATWDTANDSPHFYTTILMAISVPAGSE